MRVLYHPQLSMRSYRDNRWFVYADAQSNKMRAYVESLPDWERRWILPEVGLCDPTENRMLEDWMTRHEVSWARVPWMSNVLEGRYYIPMPELAKVTEEWRPYVLLCEVPEHARAWRAIQRHLGFTFPIISMVEHVDIYEQTKVPEEVAYHLRQVDGALVSDAVAFPLDGMKFEWLKAMYDTVNQQVTEHLLGKLHVWNA